MCKMLNYCKSGKVSTLVLLVLMGLLTSYSEAVPNREILKSNRKVNSSDKSTDIAEGKICTTQIDSIITPIITSIKNIKSTIISFIGNLTSGVTDGLGSLFTKPSFGDGGLGGLFNFTLPSKNSTSGCDLIDPLILVNLPGIFIAVPLVLIGIALIIAAIAAIVIAVGGLGGELTKEAYDKKHGESGGYAPSVMPLYGSPVSSYGSPAITGPSYSKLADNVNTATQDFNQAYDKYSSMLSQPQEPQDAQQQQQQQQQQAYSSSYTDDNQNQYDGWNNHVVMKRMKHY